MFLIEVDRNGGSLDKVAGATAEIFSTTKRPLVIPIGLSTAKLVLGELWEVARSVRIQVLGTEGIKINFWIGRHSQQVDIHHGWRWGSTLQV